MPGPVLSAAGLIQATHQPLPGRWVKVRLQAPKELAQVSEALAPFMRTRVATTHAEPLRLQEAQQLSGKKAASSSVLGLFPRPWTPKVAPPALNYVPSQTLAVKLMTTLVGNVHIALFKETEMAPEISPPILTFRGKKKSVCVCWSVYWTL